MVELRETIARLSRSFVAANIMTARDELLCGTDVTHAKQLLEENAGFDIVPIRQKDRITAFLSRDNQSSQKTIQIQHLVSSEIPIINVIDTLVNEKFVFVIGQRQVVGYIHFSDLNDAVVKIPFFVLLEGLERILSDRIRGLITDDNLSTVMKSSNRVEEIKQKMKGLKGGSADRDWATLLYFKEVLEAANTFNKAALKQEDIDNLAAVRKGLSQNVCKHLSEMAEPS